MNRFLRDMLYGVRLLLKSPGFALVTTASLAVGLGATITIFCFVNTMLLKPLDAFEPERLVRGYSGGTDPRQMVEYEDYKKYRDQNQTLSSLAMFHWGGLMPVRAGDAPAEMIHVMPVTGNYFEMLGIRPALGRLFTPADDQPAADRVVVLSDACWKQHFGANQRVIGQVIYIKNVALTIVGVTPEDFHGTIGAPVVPQFYLPWNESYRVAPTKEGHLIGRMLPGVRREQVQADLSTIAARLTADQKQPVTIQVSAATVLAPGFIGSMTLLSALFLAVVVLVLLIICSNIAILLLARSVSRRREFGVRLALGASAGQLVRQLLAESLVLAVVGGAGATALAFATARLLSQIYMPVPMPITLGFQFDWRALAFAAIATFASMLLFALAPALESVKTDVVSSLKSAGGEASAAGARSRFALVAFQIGMSTVLLVITGTLVRSLSVVRAENRGFSTERVLMATFNLSSVDYTQAQGVAFLKRVLDGIEPRQWVESATFADNVPLANNSLLTPAVMAKEAGLDEKTRENAPPVYINRISRGHFRTLQIPLVEGRDFTAQDDAAATPVGIANQTLANRFWPGESAIGKRLFAADGSEVEIVGVARDSKYEAVDEAPKALLYRPLAQSYIPTVTLLVRTRGNPAAAAPLLRREIAEIDPNVVAYNLNTMEDRVGLNLLPNRAAAIIAGILGSLALLLGTMGIYGTMAVLVQQRRREIAIRMAIGGARSDVVRLILAQGMRWTALGMGLGLLAAYFATRLLRGTLSGISAADPVAMGAVTLLLAATAYFACLVPARRASGVEPLIVLREE